jgi:hypothetical protein
MEGYVKCSEDLEFIYYKCKNKKTKYCKSALKEAKSRFNNWNCPQQSFQTCGEKKKKGK